MAGMGRHMDGEPVFYCRVLLGAGKKPRNEPVFGRILFKKRIELDYLTIPDS